jgi:hypothetical protein
MGETTADGSAAGITKVAEFRFMVRFRPGSDDSGSSEALTILGLEE